MPETSGNIPVLQLPANQSTLRAAGWARGLCASGQSHFYPLLRACRHDVSTRSPDRLFSCLALIFIFWDHVPHNPLGQITLRNFGFSDAAEVFVFLAGYAAVLAYGKVLARDGFLIACVKILRRAWVLYVVHIFLLAMLMGIVFFANSHVETRDLVE